MTDKINSTLIMYYSNMGQTWGKDRSTPQRRERSAGSSTLQKQFATYSTAALEWSKPGRQRSAQPLKGKTLGSAILFSGPGFSSVAYTPFCSWPIFALYTPLADQFSCQPLCWRDIIWLSAEVRLAMPSLQQWGRGLHSSTRSRGHRHMRKLLGNSWNLVHCSPASFR